jgi:hypothetical protein
LLVRGGAREEENYTTHRLSFGVTPSLAVGSRHETARTSLPFGGTNVKNNENKHQKKEKEKELVAEKELGFEKYTSGSCHQIKSSSAQRSRGVRQTIE